MASKTATAAKKTIITGRTRAISLRVRVSFSTGSVGAAVNRDALQIEIAENSTRPPSIMPAEAQFPPAARAAASPTMMTAIRLSMRRSLSTTALPKADEAADESDADAEEEGADELRGGP